MSSYGSVLVVGAGPVGLVAANELARRDVPVRIIDRLTEPTTESRAVVVHARSLETLARVGVADDIIAAGQRATGMSMNADGKEIVHVAFTTVRSPYPFSVTLPQDETERILTERLASLGVEVERGRELAGLEQDADGVRARLADGEEIACDWIVGTDGAHSAVRGQIGEKLEGSFKGERFLLADVDGDYDGDRETYVTWFARDAGPLFVFPMVGRRLRVIAQLDEHGGEATLEEVQRAIDERTPGFHVDNPHWITIFEIHHAQVPRYRAGRAFLAGDAAHIHSPAGGQGMNTGMQDAFNLGWKLARAAKHEASEALLDSYHAERHPIAEHVIKSTTAMTRAGTIEHPIARRLRNAAMHVAGGLAPVAHRMAAEAEETGIAYRDSPIVAGRRFGHGPRPGEIAPLVPELLPGHTVLAVGGAARDGALAVDDPDDLYGFGNGGGLVVVRPDGYIGLLAAADDGAAVDAYFAVIG